VALLVVVSCLVQAQPLVDIAEAAVPRLLTEAGEASPFLKDPKDTEVTALAKSVSKIRCLAEPEEIDRVRGRQILEDNGGTKITDILYAAKTEKELNEAFGPDGELLGDTNWLIGTAWPIVFCFVMLITWFCCCWSGCPCCGCCRCCAKERETGRILRLLVVVLLMVIIASMMICSLLALRGRDKFVAGSDTLSCASATLADNTLNGDAIGLGSFFGMIPLINNFGELDANLNDGGTLLTRLNPILASTFKMEKAIFATTETLRLLEETLVKNDAKVKALGHRCTLCEGLPTVISKVRTDLASSGAKALSDARGEVASQTSPEMRKTLQESLRSAAQPLRKGATLIRDKMEILFKKDTQDLMDTMLEFLGLGIIAVLTCAFLIAACACGSAANWAIGEKKMDVDEGTNPYNLPCVQCCSCTSWCCGFHYAALVFFLGGVMVLLSVPLCGVCLVLDDLSADTFRKMGPALGQNVSGPAFVMQAQLIDECFRGRGDGDLMTIVKITEPDQEGVMVEKTMKQKISGEVVGPMLAKFDNIGASMEGDGATVSNQPALKKLRKILRVDAVRKTIFTAAAAGKSASYASLKLDTRGQTTFTLGLQSAFLTSGVCADTNLSPEILSLLPANTAAAVIGVDTYSKRMEAIGTNIATATCAKKTNCNGAAAWKTQAVCDQANAFTDFKNALLTSTQYNCDVFARPDNSNLYCDPYALTRDAGGGYSSDCMPSSGSSATIKTKLCTLAEFEAYIIKWDARLTKTFKRIDDTVADIKDTVVVGMKGIVDEFIITPINITVNSSKCHFLETTYSGLVDGLCYQLVWGLVSVSSAYLACGVLTLIMIVLIYGVWRRSYDNYKSWEKESAKSSE